VSPDPADPLPPEAEIALAWTPPKVRGPLSIALQFDRRLARIVARTTEPMLGQMRLAWWREALGKPVAERPRGDAVLDAIGQYWQGREAGLAAMVDGWEVLVTAETIGSGEAAAFGTGRGAFFAALSPDPLPESMTARLAAAGKRWALADAAASVSARAERSVMVAEGLAGSESRGRFPRALRGLAVLDALALRALRQGGRPMMEGRGAPLAAFRGAIFRA
jgi:15-cis-phytoene synthase